MGIDCCFKDVFVDVVDGFVDVRYVQQFVMLGVDCLVLVVGYIIIFQQLFMDIEVMVFYFMLGVGDCFGDLWVFNCFIWFYFQFMYYVRYVIGGEDMYQGIFY